MADPVPKVFVTDANLIPFATNGLDAPTFYVDYIRGTMAGGGVIKLNFVENRLDASDGSVKTAHVVTLVAPLAQVRA